MRSIRTLGPCLVAALAIAGVLASSASAQPTWYECAKIKHGGNYANSTCTEPSAPGAGAYELKPGVGKGKAFKGKQIGQAVLHVKTWLPEAVVDCKSATLGGKPVAPNLEEDVTVTYKGCETAGLVGAHKCTSPGAKTGEIKVPAMRGELGYVEESPSVVVGLRLEDEAHPGGLIVEFKCETVEAKVGGQLIGVQQKDVNAISKKSETVDEATERYGTHEYEGKAFKPVVNLLGWASEVPGIEEAQRKDEEETDPAHVLRGEFCGEFIEETLHKTCSPPAYMGQDQTSEATGEALMIKA